MARQPLSALLDRFRRGVAVPAAVGDELSLELAPVFASLELIEEEARQLRESSEKRAEEHLVDGRERAAAISAGWREQAEEERARAAEERRRRAREEAAAIEASGLAEAERIRARAASRSSDLVSRIVACVERGAR